MKKKKRTISSEINSQSNIAREYIDKKENEDNNEDESIKPYLNALTFFKKIKKIYKSFGEKFLNNNLNHNLSDIYSIEDFINYFKKNNINPQKDDDFQKKLEKENLRNNPHKIFSFFLDELHKVFKDVKNNDNDNENKQKIKAVEYDSQAAKKLFMDYMEEDKSYISETFFGCKKIVKLCKNCGLTQYIYKYIKVMPLTILYKENVEDILQLEDLFSLTEEKFTKKYFCQMCSSEQDFNVVIKMSKKPKILIIIVKNNKKVNIEKTIFNNEYRLIGAEISYEKPKNIFYSIFGCNKNKKTYNNMLYNGKEHIFNLDKNDKLLNDDKINTGIPYVLFYKRNKGFKEKSKDMSFEKEFNDDLLISVDKGNKVEFEDRNYSSKEDLKNPYNSNDKKEITLYFTLKSNGKEIYIDTDDCKTFSEIVVQIKMKYDWAVHVFDENKLFFKNKNIDCHKTPRQLGIKNESRIYVG